MRPYEKRRSQRVRIKDGFAHCLSGVTVGVFRIRDLSTGGALLSGATPLSVGSQVDLFLYFRDHPNIVASATVRQRRFSAEHRAFAVEFDRISGQDEVALTAIVASEAWRTAQPRVIICDGSTWNRDVLATLLQREDFEVIEAASPLEAITLLDDPGLPIQAVIIGPELGLSSPENFVRLLLVHYPMVRRILVARPQTAAGEALGALADAVLPQRFTIGQLKAVFTTAHRDASNAHAAKGQPAPPNLD